MPLAAWRRSKHLGFALRPRVGFVEALYDYVFENIPLSSWWGNVLGNVLKNGQRAEMSALKLTYLKITMLVIILILQYLWNAS